MTVFLLAPVNRVIERMDMPSTIMPRICARRCDGNLFMIKMIIDE
jgi:hypothetical protein